MLKTVEFLQDPVPRLLTLRKGRLLGLATKQPQEAKLIKVY